MNRKLAFVLIAALLVPGLTWANVGPAPLPKGRKVVDPRVRFLDVDKHPGHVFYLYWGAHYSNFETVEVKNSEPIKIVFKLRDFTPSIYMQMMAVERTKFEEQKQLDPKLDFLRRKNDWVLTTHVMPVPAGTASELTGEAPVATYRVEVKYGKLNVGKVEPMKTSAAPPAGLAPPWMLALALSLSLAWGGVWFARR